MATATRDLRPGLPLARQAGFLDRAGDGTFSATGASYQALLGASDFSLVTSTVSPIRCQWTVAQVIDYLYSTSFASPHLFGDRRSAFEAAVTDALACFTDGGVLSEDNAFTVHTARHPSAHENGCRI
ncbi:hypothetical protein ACFTZF_15705 [Streptomyces mirabilis]|uniref:hypothetical protein n=1 Tax=Streptomyces mirabilis TaxID=68239 RepID=UPI0036319CFC